ncbi:hypothetical protein Sjap_003828 [Stephania japonica]|uniref:C2 domain-containing protein n=1 Tax=Stephania japonica TaxID=461633 RepID=A0AAP0KR31_9MAGN
MAHKLQQQLREVGAKLESPPTSKDSLIKLLKQSATCLSEVDQSPVPKMLDSMKSFLNAIVQPDLLKHQDRDVRLLVAACICEVTRITAPEAPYSDDVLRDIFRLIVGTFSGLSDVSSPSFGRRVAILETLARYRSCVVMLDLECNDLVNEMFSTFFSVASDDHPESVLTSMQTIMALLLEESEDIQDNLLITLLSVLGRGKSDVSGAARKIAMNVIEQCAGKLEPYVKQFLISSMSGDNSSLNSQVDYHEVIYDIYCCAPQILSGVIPYLTGELLTDQLHTRLKAVKLLGDLFALQECPVPETFQPIFSEFLKRLTDRVVDVRLSVIEHVRSCLLSDPFRVEATDIIAALCDRLLDYDENVRKQVVGAVCDVACFNLKAIPVETLRIVAERLRDKSLLVKRYTMDRLAEIYRLRCLKSSDVSINSVDYEWIPGKILRCFYDKDFRSETIEFVLCSSLFPIELSIKDRVKHWLNFFSSFDKVEIKALEKIMEQKQRLQLEMQKYLSLRQMQQDHDSAEFQKKVLLCFRVMSRWFVDPVKAEESFQTLGHLKDANIWKILTNISDPNTSFHQAWIYRDDLLKILGEKHPLFDFLGTLSMKCSYLLLNKDYVKEILLEAATQRSTGNTQFTLACMNLLVVIASFSPLLFSGSEEDLVQFLKEDNELTKEGALQILARAGGTIREQLAVTSGSVDLILERLCLEGSRRQAKYAVHALAAITVDDGLKSLSVLYKRLVDMLEEKTHLPAVLQSLGCIAQTAMPVFETRENEIVEFIKINILELNKAEDNTENSWDKRSELCLLKIFGLKTLVKSFLPVKDAHLRHGFENLLTILRNILSFGEISEQKDSSSVDKAHMKLAAAKAVLRLSKHWDHKIPTDVFCLTLAISELSYPEARKIFLGKVHQYIKDRLLDVKYSCAFLFNNANEFQQPEFKEDKHNLGEIIQICYQAKARQLPMLCDSNPSMAYPGYLLPILVHVLAHHSSCPNIDECTDIKVYEPMYRQLYLFISILLYGEDDIKSELATSASKEKETISSIMSILRSIKCSEDAVDAMKSKNSHAICDLGLSIAKRLSPKQEDATAPRTSVPLPPALYKPLESKGDESSGDTWLADEKVLAHFESLKLYPNETIDEDDAGFKDIDEDGNDVPLGKMIKHIKSQSIKAKKTGKKKILPAEKKDPENDVDILGMVREINLHSLEESKNLESGNGREFTTEEMNGRINGEKASTSQKVKRKQINDPIHLTVQKRKRSSLGHAVRKSSHSGSSLIGVRKAFEDHSHHEKTPSFDPETGNKKHANSTDELSISKEAGEPMETDLLASCLPVKKNLSSKLKHVGNGLNNVENVVEEIGRPEIEMSNEHMTADEDDSLTPKSTPVSKKRKRRSIAGLAKCSLKEVENQSLVGCRIKVWWPLDKQFYEGLVQSYDSEKKKHVILYDDGDSEVLVLDKERWELATDVDKPRKEQKTSKISPGKGVSPEKKKNSKGKSGGSQRNKKFEKSSSSGVKRRRMPKKGLEKKSHDYLEGELNVDVSETESREVSELSNPEHGGEALMNSGDSEEKQTEEAGKSSGVGDDGDNKSGHESKGIEDGDKDATGVEDHHDKEMADERKSREADKSQTDVEHPGEGEKSDSMEKEEIVTRPNEVEVKSDKEDTSDVADKSPGGLKQSENNVKSDKSSSGATDDSDDETLVKGLMGKTIGLLKVSVLRGQRLVIRDFRTSDPYVVLKLDNQVVKTKVISNSLNPVWNEEFTFSITEPVGVLNLEVFDKDRFKADDEMGYAHIGLQQIVSAARLKKFVGTTEGATKIRTIVPENDNCFAKESCIRCIDGEIVQDACLRLCSVESGEIELKLKWIDDPSLTAAAATATATAASTE